MTKKYTLFRDQLRNLINRANITQDRAAKLLQISLKTLESWLSESDAWGRTPHFLVQIGAMRALQLFISNGDLKFRRAANPCFLWDVTHPNGDKITIISLRKFTNNAGLNYSGAYQAARLGKKYKGWYFSRKTK